MKTANTFQTIDVKCIFFHFISDIIKKNTQTSIFTIIMHIVTTIVYLQYCNYRYCTHSFIIKTRTDKIFS